MSGFVSFVILSWLRKNGRSLFSSDNKNFRGRSPKIFVQVKTELNLEEVLGNMKEAFFHIPAGNLIIKIE